MNTDGHELTTTTMEGGTGRLERTYVARHVRIDDDTWHTLNVDQQRESHPRQR